MCKASNAEKMGSKDNNEDLKPRRQLLLHHVTNKTCADCRDLSPQFVSLQLKPLPKATMPVGVFCCGSCAKLHRELGENICIVKHIFEYCKCHEVTSQ
jgi:Putative GTPase activating protein for Arf